MSYYFSIVITTFNRKALLLKCLDSLKAQQFNNSEFEVCIVDDGSSDGTSTLLHENKYPFQSKMVSVLNGGPSNARNIGANIVSGKYIVFLEDDVTVHTDWLMNAYELLKTELYDVLEGRTIYQNTKKDVRLFDNEEYLSFIPCNLFIRKEVFLKSGGYDPEFNSVRDNLYFRDDTELGFRLLEDDIRIKKSTNIIAEHPEQFSDINLCFRHAMRYQFDPLLYKKHPRKYRTSIEVKKIFGMTLHRPQHYAYLTYVILTISAALSVLYDTKINILFFLFPIVALAFVFRVKYQGIDSIKIYKIADTLGFFVLPFIYTYAFLKGCIRYRSFGALL